MVTFGVVNNRHATQAQVMLKVMVLESILKEIQEYGLVSKASVLQLDPNFNSTFVFMYARTHPQFVIKLKLSDSIPEGYIALNEAQCLNFEVTTGEDQFPWSVYTGQDPTLNFLQVDVLRCSNKDIVYDKQKLAAALKKQYWNCIITLHERFMLQVNGVEFAFRVGFVAPEDTDDDEDDDDSLVREDTYRGIVDTTTRVKFVVPESFGITLEGEDPVYVEQEETNMIDVYCRDDEWFPVKKRLLQPCIFLASYVVAAKSERQSVHIDMDCCLFDRVLVYLESEIKGKAYKIDIHQVEKMLSAAIYLQISGLRRLCERVLGEYTSAIRKEGIPFDEIVQRNNDGECLLIIDNNVIDVTNWLEHHPGGNVIIPSQALNVDSTVMFEVYHNSRESFIFLKQLYIGPLKEEDIPKVPPPVHFGKDTVPSESFLVQLREFMGEIKVYTRY